MYTCDIIRTVLYHEDELKEEEIQPKCQDQFNGHVLSL